MQAEKNQYTDSPFDLANESAYQQWKDAKLEGYPESIDDLIVEINDPCNLTSSEHAELLRLCRKTNMALYASSKGSDPDKNIIRDFGKQFGLNRLDNNMCADDDAVTSLTVRSDNLHKGYIPYTCNPITWHTDGYYNRLGYQIHGLILHCVQPADKGGENELLDHEIAYMLLRDKNPEYIAAFLHAGAMTIPANVVDGEVIRPAQTGPVFSVQPDGHLHMRFTARTRSIRWYDDQLLHEAIDFLNQQLKEPGQWHFRGKLAAGQGLLCTNVLHTRTAFEDNDNHRLLYRARYFDRIKDL